VWYRGMNKPKVVAFLGLEVVLCRLNANRQVRVVKYAAPQALSTLNIPHARVCRHRGVWFISLCLGSGPPQNGDKAIGRNNDMDHGRLDATLQYGGGSSLAGGEYHRGIKTVLWRGGLPGGRAVSTTQPYRMSIRAFIRWRDTVLFSRHRWFQAKPINPRIAVRNYLDHPKFRLAGAA